MKAFSVIIIMELLFISIGSVYHRDTIYLQNRYIMERHERECKQCRDLYFCNPYSENLFYLKHARPNDNSFIRYFNELPEPK